MSSEWGLNLQLFKNIYTLKFAGEHKACRIIGLKNKIANLHSILHRAMSKATSG